MSKVETFFLCRYVPMQFPGFKIARFPELWNLPEIGKREFPADWMLTSPCSELICYAALAPEILLKSDALELRRLLGLTSNQYAKKLLTNEAEKLEKQISSLEEKDAKPVQKVSPRPHTFTTKIINYAWDQSEKFVKLYVSLKNVQTLSAESITSTFNSKSVDLHVSDLDSKNFSFAMNNLMYEIKCEESYHKVKSDMVVLYLRKMSTQSWPYVTESEKKAKEPRMPRPDENEDPSQSLMTLMKQMYDDGDDEMKRTIAKAWTEAREKQSPDML